MLEHLDVDPECGELARREIQTSPVEVFTDVADEVGQLKRLTEIRRGHYSFLLRNAHSENREHLQTDDDGGAVHVLGKLVHRVVDGSKLRGVGGVHPHGLEEGVEVCTRNVERLHSIGEGREYACQVEGNRRREATCRSGVVECGDGCTFDVGEHRASFMRTRGFVHDVVDDASKCVESVNCAASRLGQQPSGQKVRSAVFPRHVLAEFIGRRQCVHDTRITQILTSRAPRRLTSFRSVSRVCVHEV